MFWAAWWLLKILRPNREKYISEMKRETLKVHVYAYTFFNFNKTSFFFCKVLFVHLDNTVLNLS